MEFSANRKSEDYKISRDEAVRQICLVLEYYDFEPKDIEDVDEKKAIDKALEKLTRAIRLGKLEVISGDEYPFFKQYLNVKKGQDPNPENVLEYKGAMPKAKGQTDGYAASARFAMMCSFLGSLSGVGPNGIKKLNPQDLAIAEVIAGFLLIAVS